MSCVYSHSSVKVTRLPRTFMNSKYAYANQLQPSALNTVRPRTPNIVFMRAPFFKYYILTTSKLLKTTSEIVGPRGPWGPWPHGQT